MTPKISFCILGINTHNFVKNDPNFESKGLFDLKFYGIWYKKFLDPKALTFGV